MKSIRFSLIAAAFVLTTAALKAQPLVYSGAQATTYTAGTNKAMALTTNAFFTIDVPRADSTQVALLANYSFLNAPGAGDATSITIDFFRGIDSGSYETNAWFSWVVPGNSTTPASQVTNINVGAVGYLRARVKNFSTNAHATNILIQYGFRR